jgi:adenine-specific DNA-methyltransferase
MRKNNQNLSKEKLLVEIERLKKELKKKKKYGLVWEKERNLEEVVEICREKLPVLKEVKNKEIISDKDKPVNLLIEGDNYHALSVLNYTHAKKVDVIYIDPPYNTGKKKEWKFNDHWIDSEDTYRHSKWISFMEKRLILAKDLLKDTGIIFISIDDNEYAQLKLLCDYIFREKNFVSNIIWKSRSSLQYSEPLISSQTEYILLYAKNKKIWGDDYFRFDRIKKEMDELSYSNPDSDPNGKWTSSGLIRDDGRKKYTIITPSGKKYTEAWLYTKANMEKFRRENLLWFGKDGDAKPRKKSYWKDYEGKVSSSLLQDEFIIFKKKDGELKKDKVFEIGTTELGTKELKNIFNLKRAPFDYPKPTTLLRYLFKLYPVKNITVLDFFAGTGTTGHTVLKLNKEDGCNRKFILCTNNENNICTNICYPRIKKVIEGYKKLKGEKVEGLGGNLKYFKADEKTFINAEPTDRNKIKLTEQATEMLCVKEGTFEPVVDNKRFKIFKNSNHYTGIIWDQTIIPEFKKKIKGIKGKFSVYVFSLSDETFDDEFKDVKQKIQLSPIPETILRVYRRIFK